MMGKKKKKKKKKTLMIPLIKLVYLLSNLTDQNLPSRKVLRVQKDITPWRKPSWRKPLPGENPPGENPSLKKTLLEKTPPWRKPSYGVIRCWGLKKQEHGGWEGRAKAAVEGGWGAAQWTYGGAVGGVNGDSTAKWWGDDEAWWWRGGGSGHQAVGGEM